MARVQEFLMQLEEEGIQLRKFIPEEERAKTEGVKIDCVRRTATTTAVRLGEIDDERTVVMRWGVGCGIYDGPNIEH